MTLGPQVHLPAGLRIEQGDIVSCSSRGFCEPYVNIIGQGFCVFEHLVVIALSPQSGGDGFDVEPGKGARYIKGLSCGEDFLRLELLMPAPSQSGGVTNNVPGGTECNGYNWAQFGHFALPITDAIFCRLTQQESTGCGCLRWTQKSRAPKADDFRCFGGKVKGRQVNFESTGDYLLLGKDGCSGGRKAPLPLFLTIRS